MTYNVFGGTLKLPQVQLQRETASYNITVLISQIR